MTRIGEIDAPPALPVAAGSARPLPPWLPWLFLLLLVLPFHPHWIDFEQARRGLLLVLAGTCWLVWPQLPRARGETAFVAFLSGLCVSAVISLRSLQAMEAVYRIAHWVALLLVLRLGAARSQSFATPLATVLCLGTAFGLLQRHGLAELAGYGTPNEPVAMLGNLNVAAEFTAVAAAGVAVLGTQRAWLGQLALLLAGAYLVVNGSRSALIALPVALCLLPLLRRRLGLFLPLVLVLLGGLLGSSVDLLLRRNEAPTAVSSAAPPAPSTLAVRLELAKSSVALFAERPLFGFGPGQFQVQYPRVRSQREIELSSFGRQFATEARTAHDDWLELLVEGGLPLWLLFAALVFSLQRGKGDKAALLPLLCLLLLMFVRAPLGNAAAVAVAFLLVAARAPEWRPVGKAGAWLLRILGCSLLALGVLPIMANTWAAPYVAAQGRGELGDPRQLQRAHAWLPFEPRFLQLLAQEQMAQGDLAAARRHAAQACRLRPHDPHLLLLLGEILARGGAVGEAAAIASEGLRKDPNHPELRVLRSTALLQQGDTEAAVLAVVEQPHPVLLAQLPNHFRALARLAAERGDAQAAARCELEQLCLELLPSLGQPDAESRVRSDENLRLLLDAAQRAGVSKNDLRPYLLNARHYQALGEAETVARLAAAAGRTGAVLPAWQRELLAPVLAELGKDPAWRPLLQ